MSIVGLCLVVISAYQLRDSVRLARHGVLAEGRVERIDYRSRARRSVAFSPRVHVTVGGAPPGACVIKSREFSVGQSVEVLVLPDDPSVCSLPTRTALWGGPGGGVVAGSLLFLGALAYLERERRRSVG